MNGSKKDGWEEGVMKANVLGHLSEWMENGGSENEDELCIESMAEEPHGC